MAHFDVQAKLWEKLEDNKVRCLLCPTGCVIADGGQGQCRVRRNKGGVLYAASYGEATALAVDPIEKKPLYHYFPGWDILSIGSWGCNFKCGYCQNCDISQIAESGRFRVEPAQLVAAATRAPRNVGLAYTYNEPLIWYEFLLDCGAAMREAGLRNVLVTNGYINPEPLRQLLPLIDAVNMDLKSFSDDFYKRICKGRLDPVLRSAEAFKESCHLEVTYLLIPGENDSEEETEALARWVAEHLGRDTPLHISRFFPRYKWSGPPTALSALARAREIAKQHLDHVFVGNAEIDGASNTYCPACGAVLIQRLGYQVSLAGLAPDGSCRSCGAKTSIVMPESER